jgi:hypothetical protein
VDGVCRIGAERWLRFVLTRRVVWLCILAQFVVDILGHAYAVFRSQRPVTFENIAKYGARDFHAESWCISAIICIVFGVYLLIKTVDALNDKEYLPVYLDTAMRRFSYIVALFASISAHVWWDGILSFG